MRRFVFPALVDLAKYKGLWRQAVFDQNFLEFIRSRVLITGVCFTFAFTIISARLIDVMVLRGLPDSELEDVSLRKDTPRAEILDRNGMILATHLVTGSVYANPSQMSNVEKAAEKLATVLPNAKYENLLAKLRTSRKFVWVARHISPRLQQEVLHLGIPGVYLQKDSRRIYPYGALVSHVIGHCDLDGRGLAGAERSLDKHLREGGQSMVLSIDVRIQHIVRHELTRSVDRFSANGGNALVLDLSTGEILAMVSLPDYDNNHIEEDELAATFNRNTLGIYEPGSTFKVFNTAIALETGRATLQSVYDASVPLRVGRFHVTDFKAKNRPLSVQEAFLYSSNIANAKMALHFGSTLQRAFLKKFGMFDPPQIELTEISAPLVPKHWSDATTITVSYGYGISVSPLQLLVGIGSIINDGHRVRATLLHDSYHPANEHDVVISQKTSNQIRDLMRLVITEGTGKSANVAGYDVIGKTGTAHVLQGHSYAAHAKITTFIGAFPHHHPQYMVLVMLDNPKALSETHGYSTAGWNAAPTAGKIIARMAPLLCVKPISQDNDTMPTGDLIATSHVNTDFSSVE